MIGLADVVDWAVAGLAYGSVAVAAGTVTYAVLFSAWGLIEESVRRAVGPATLQAGAPIHRKGLGALWRRSWQPYVDRRARALGLARWAPILGSAYLAIVILLMAIAVSVGTRVSANGMAGALLGAFAVLAPETLLQAVVRMQGERLTQQLGLAVQIFSTEVAATPHVHRALAATARRLGEPVRTPLLWAVRRLDAGDDYREVFRRLAGDLGEHGPAFAQLLEATWQDARAGKMCGKLGQQIAQDISFRRKADAGIAGIRTLGVGLNLLLIPAILAVSHYVPQTREYLLNTQEGQGAVVVTLASLVGGLAIQRLMAVGIFD